MSSPRDIAKDILSDPFKMAAIILAIGVGIFLFSFIPDLFLRDTIDVIDYLGGDAFCEEIKNVQIPSGSFITIDDRNFTKIGLETNPDYNIFYGYRKTVFGFYHLYLVRCDYTGAFFKITCDIYAPEGGKENILFVDDKEIYVLKYEGESPEMVLVKCYPDLS